MLIHALTYIFPDFDPLRDAELRGDGGEPVIVAWYRGEPQPTPAEIAAAELPATKNYRIAAINSECRTRLIARFGDPAEQVSRSLGVYGQTEKAALETGIAATIDASNTASDLVTAATSIAEVEAVTVAWPVI